MGRIEHEVTYTYEAFKVAGEAGAGYEPVVAALQRLDEQVAIARKASSDAIAQELTGPESTYDDLFVSLRGWVKRIGDFDAARDELRDAGVGKLPPEEDETFIVNNALKMQWALKTLEVSATLPTLYEDFHRQYPAITEGRLASRVRQYSAERPWIRDHARPLPVVWAHQ